MWGNGHSLTQTVSVCSGLRDFPGSGTFHAKHRKFWVKPDAMVNLKYQLYGTTVLEPRLAIGIKNLFYKYIIFDAERLLPGISSNKIFIRSTNICGGSTMFPKGWRYQDIPTRIV